MTTLNSLQAGRALAAIAVAAFHLSINMGIERYGGQAVFADYTWFGDRGVDFFFVLSGFIILLAHHRDIGQPATVATYLQKRFVRVFPVYWIYTLGFVAAFMVVGATDAKIPTNAADWLTTISLLRFTTVAPPLPVAWTLFHEVAFYAAFALLIVNRRVGLLVMGAWALVALVNYHYPAENARTAWSVYTSAYALFFMFGMGAYLLYRRGVGGAFALVAGLAVVVAGIGLSRPLGDLAPLLVAAGFAAALLGATTLERRGHVNVPDWFVFLGNASYSIYLTHLACEGLLLKVAMRLHLHERIGYGTTYIAVLAGAVALGCIAYVIVERPLLAHLRPRIDKRAAATGTAAAA